MGSPRILLVVALLASVACNGPAAKEQPDKLEVDSAHADARVRPQIYAPVKLNTDLSKLDARQLRLVWLLIQAAQVMDSLFWQEAWGAPDSIPMKHPPPEVRRFFAMNYGPWDRLAGDAPFIDGVGPKPKGARFYPADLTDTEFKAWDDPGKNGRYTMVRRDSTGKLTAIPYHRFFGAPINRAAALLAEASAYAGSPGLRAFLVARAEALRTDSYERSDLAWMDMRANTIDIIIGPIETYEDQLYGYKAAHEAYVLLKDKEWTARLERFAKLLPMLQRELPVPAAYKRELPGSDGQLGAYDVVYYAGACNAGGKTVAVNLPNEEAIQLKKGTRRLQLKNAMKAKFDKIMLPIAGVLVAEDQRRHVTFDAFFQNVMFHEVAHGLGIKNTINGKGTVRNALLDEASALEEGKADILGLHMVEQLRQQGEISEGDLMDNYVTFMASVFRSVRFGTTSAHGRANLVRFNFLLKAGAFVRDDRTETYRVDAAKMHRAVTDLGALILKLQGDGDLAGVRAMMKEFGAVPAVLQKDLARLEQAGIPVDVVFEQGPEVLGLDAAR